jgi:hypothetical protein
MSQKKEVDANAIATKSQRYNAKTKKIERDEINQILFLIMK